MLMLMLMSGAIGVGVGDDVGDGWRVLLMCFGQEMTRLAEHLLEEFGDSV